MADNIELNAGTGGAVIATDDAGAAGHVQVVKLAVSADGSATVIPADAGNGLDVDVTRMAALVAGDAAVGRVKVTDGTDVALVSAGGALLVDASATTQPVSGTVAVTGVATAANQTTIIGHVDGIEALLTTIAGDTTDIEAALETVGGLVVNLGANNDVTVTGTVDLGATDNAVLDAIAASTAAIETAVEGTLTVTGGGGGVEYTEGDTDATITGSVAMMEVAADTLQPIQGTVAGGLLVNLGSNNDVTVTGTVDLGATDNAVLDAIAASVAAADTDLTTIIGHVDGIEGVLGTIDADTGSIMTAVQLIDDTVAVLGTDTYTETTTKGLTIGAVRRDADTTLVGTTNEIGPLQMDANGRLKVEAFSGETLPVSGTVTANLAAGTNNIGDVDVLTLPSLPAGTNGIGKLTANSGVDIGDVDVTSISAGTNAIGNVGLIGRTTGGLTPFNSIDIDESEEEIKSSAGQVFSVTAWNTTAAPLWLRFYNATAANTTVGSTATYWGPFLVPGNADSDGAGFVWNNTIGMAFSTAISVACTTGVAANDTGAPGANACIVNVGYM